MSDRERLAGYIDTWWTAVGDVLALLERLEPEQWNLPTDLPGWDVHAVAAHLAHLEAVLAGVAEETAQFQPPAHVRSPMGFYTEQGVVARRDRSPEQVIDELRSSAAARHAKLAADPPTDGTAGPIMVFGGIGWDTETLLRNRVLDVWMHEQDIRRATGLTGNLDSPAARHTAEMLAEALGLVLAKRAGAPPGTTLVAEITGSAPIAFTVNESRRGQRLAEIPADPSVRLRFDVEPFVLLAGGRLILSPDSPDSTDIATVDGDTELGRRILASMAVTP